MFESVQIIIDPLNSFVLKELYAFLVLQKNENGSRWEKWYRLTLHTGEVLIGPVLYNNHRKILIFLGVVRVDLNKLPKMNNIIFIR